MTRDVTRDVIRDMTRIVTRGFPETGRQIGQGTCEKRRGEGRDQRPET